MKRLHVGIVVLIATGWILSQSTAIAQQKFVIKPLAEKKVAALPAGPLYWRIENFTNGLFGSGVNQYGEPVASARSQAEAVAGPWALVAESAGKVWLFTLGPADEASVGGTKVAELGPIPRVNAPEYMLRINEASGPPGSMTGVHSHPGSEAFFVLAGEQSIRSPHGLMRVKAGQAEAGNGADSPMQVSSSGSTGLHSLVMFVVDATRPFSSPTKMP
jgi:hypothetical protein